MKYPKLLPCPFCGATEESGMVYVEESPFYNYPVTNYQVVCNICGITMSPISAYEPWSFSRYEAASRWNSRANE